MGEHAKRSLLLMARCLVLAPYEDHLLFGREFSSGRNGEGLKPPFSSAKTAKLMLEAMRK
jgi:hypothetical protein